MAATMGSMLMWQRKESHTAAKLGRSPNGRTHQEEQGDELDGSFTPVEDVVWNEDTNDNAGMGRVQVEEGSNNPDCCTAPCLCTGPCA